MSLLGRWTIFSGRLLKLPHHHLSGAAATAAQNPALLNPASVCMLSTGSGAPSPSTAEKPKTAILMMNMGGPRSLDEVEPFLHRLFTDADIIKLPMQSILGPWIARRRAPKVTEKYAQIGGGSPIHYWTDRQGDLIVEQLDRISPQTAPHKHYTGFRYVHPLLEDALEQIERDQVSNVIAFSQYAQYCCNTTGSSINAMAKFFMGRHHAPTPNFKLSFIDRWSMNTGLVAAFKQLIEAEICKFPHDRQSDVLLLFTAHSIPLRSVNAGDTYPMEVSATVMQVMQALSFRYPYRLVWQSKVGPMPWQGPKTDQVIKGFATKGFKNMLLIPISFVNEHIETLHELDIEYAEELAAELPSVEKIRRCPTPNDHPEFIRGLVETIVEHIDSKRTFSRQLPVQCPLCQKDVCVKTRQWLATIADTSA